MSAGQTPPSGPPLPAGLLEHWGIPPLARLTAAHGTNNQTFVVRAGSARWVLRISQNLTQAQVRAEHRLLARLRQARLPFAVPEPVPALTGDFVAETAAGPATVTKWLPGVRPDLSDEQALERFGRAIGQLGAALGRVPRQDAPHDWLSSPHVHPEVPDVAELCRELAAAGISPAMGTVVWRAGRWRRGQASLGDVSVRLHGLAEADKWLAAHGSELLGLLRRSAA